MKRCSWLSLGHKIRATIAAVVLLGSVWLIEPHLDPKPVGASSPDVHSRSNNHLFRNPGGKSATSSTQGSVDLTGEYFQAQGTNGRSCVSCHIPEEAWSALTPARCNTCSMKRKEIMNVNTSRTAK